MFYPVFRHLRHYLLTRGHLFLSVASQVTFDILLPVEIVTGLSLLCLEDLVFLI